MKKLILSLLACIFISTGFSQITITGTVYDNDSVPIPEVNIALKSTELKTKTDYDGKYSITIPEKYKETGILSFLAIDTKKYEEQIKNRDSIDVVLNDYPKFTITGTVVDEKGETIPMATVSLTEVANLSIAADFDGYYSLVIPKRYKRKGNIKFSTVGFNHVTKQIKGKRKINVTLTTGSCNPEPIVCSYTYIFVNTKFIGIGINKGLINNPYGGELSLQLFPFYKNSTLKAGINYQTNFDKNYFLNAQVGLNYIKLNHNFNMGINYFYRKLSLDNDFNSTIHSIETDLRFNNLNFYIIAFTLGYSNLTYKEIETNENLSHGTVIGFSLYLRNPLQLSLSNKMTFFKDKIEYQAEIEKHIFNNFYAMINYYQLDNYKELSFGIGIYIYK